MIAIDTQGEYVLADPTVRAEIEKRIEPVGKVILAGSEELAAAAAPPVAAPERVAAPMTGAQVYNAACFACHAPPGIAGAPPLGDGNAWTARIAQGMETMTDHAINGYQGSTGFMPAKGGRGDLSDEEIVAAIEYMLEQVAQ
jgi:cytochrome c5